MRQFGLWLNIPRLRLARATDSLLGTAAAFSRGALPPQWFDALSLVEEEAAALEWDVNSARERAAEIAKHRGEQA